MGQPSDLPYCFRQSAARRVCSTKPGATSTLPETVSPARPVLREPSSNVEGWGDAQLQVSDPEEETLAPCLPVVPTCFPSTEEFGSNGLAQPLFSQRATGNFKTLPFVPPAPTLFYLLLHPPFPRVITTPQSGCMRFWFGCFALFFRLIPVPFSPSPATPLPPGQRSVWSLSP